MAAEKRSNAVKITFEVAESLRKKFAAQSKKLNVSVAQRLRDLMQRELRK